MSDNKYYKEKVELQEIRIDGDMELDLILRTAVASSQQYQREYAVRNTTYKKGGNLAVRHLYNWVSDKFIQLLLHENGTEHMRIRDAYYALNDAYSDAKYNREKTAPILTGVLESVSPHDIDNINIDLLWNNILTSIAYYRSIATEKRKTYM